MNWKRFPALILGLVAVVVQVGGPLLFAFSPEQDALVAAVTVALVGVATAWLVRGDALVAAIVGLAQAMLALGLGFGLALPADTQSLIMAAVAAAAAAFVHSQVVGPVPATLGHSPLAVVPVPPPARPGEGFR